MYHTIPSDDNFDLYCAYRISRTSFQNDDPIPAIYMSPPGNTSPSKPNSCISYAQNTCKLESQCDSSSRYRVAQCDYRTDNGAVVLILRIETPVESDYGEWRCLVIGDSTVNASVNLVTPGETLFLSTTRTILLHL